MMDLAAESGDEFGGLDDDELLLAAEHAEEQGTLARPENRAPKRQKTLNGGSGTLLSKDRPWNELDGDDPETDLFSSRGVIEITSQQSYKDYRPPSPAQERLVGPQTNLRQMTLFGSEIGDDLTQSHPSAKRQHNWPRVNKAEPPTHHGLDLDELGSWIYPTNLGKVRDYQFNIVSRALYHNLLVALPTGLGKTFIAATVMLNWYRWTKDAQIVFLAPTKPLVAQQVEACFNTAGIPRSVTTMLTGGIIPALRAVEWNSKRVFFMTPQTMVNDLKAGYCDPKRIVLLVVDEAHRATGSYAYVEVVKFLKRFNTSFRVLALTATPGSSVEGVQEVIDGLSIARVEIRTEESLDIRQYVHPRSIDTTRFDPSEEMVMITELFSKSLQPLLDKLCGMNAYWSKDPISLTPFGCTQARQKWMSSDAGRNANYGVKGMVNSVFSILASLSHATELLKYHGIGPFYHKVSAFRTEILDAGQKGSKYKRDVIENDFFRTMINRIQSWVLDKEFIGHPKLEYVRSIVMNHFLDANEGSGSNATSISSVQTRIIIFVHYRDSAEEVVRVLKRNHPIIRPHVFVGQANAKGSEGMGQKKQQEVVDKLKTGEYNTLVATSIGEEGLDIGEVDLIICYDASASPIRMLQRMGRTGRKRAGKIEVTLMKGKEERNFFQAKDNYEKMQKMIAEGTQFHFHEDLSPRILPRDAKPIVIQKAIEIPLENTQADLPEPKKRGKIPKRPPKKFHMPDNVRIGFTRASRLDEDEDSQSEQGLAFVEGTKPPRSPPPVSIPKVSSVALNPTELRDLEQTYMYVSGTDMQVVMQPRTDVFPTLQRDPRPIEMVRHGKLTKRIVKMLAAMHESGTPMVENYERNLQDQDKIVINQNSLRNSKKADNSISKLDECDSDEADLLSAGSVEGMSYRRGTRHEIAFPSSGHSETKTRKQSHYESIDDEMFDFIDDGDDLDTRNGKVTGTPTTLTPTSTVSKSSAQILAIRQSPSEPDSTGPLPDLDQLPIFQSRQVPEAELVESRRRRRAVIESDSEDA